MFSLKSSILLPVLTVAMLGVAVEPARAALVSMVSTGVDDSGARLALGAADPHWRVVAGPGIAAPATAWVAPNQHPFGQYFERPDSAWIWVDSESAAGAVGEPYTLELSIDLSNFNPATLSLSGFWGADNYGRILLNGASAIGSGELELVGVNTDHFNFGHAFTINGGFVPGINRLSFEITDDSNPGGLNVYGLVVDAVSVPEPGSLAIFSTALGLMGLARRRSGSRADLPQTI